MKAIVYHGPAKLKWQEMEKPKLLKSTDALVKIVKTTICGTDLHILKGDVPTVTPGRILGHEGVGIIEEVGSNVSRFKKGDRVLISCITSCGVCRYCKRALTAHCEDGGWILGNLIDGTQAEYARIPHAENSLYRIPEGMADEDVLMLSDILPTGFEIGVLNGKVKPGDTIALVGAGPIGMAALITSLFYSPAKIIAIDMNEDRLEFSKKIGATHTINPLKQDVNKEISSITDGDGVDVAIECVGIPASFDICQSIISKGGHIANVGVHGKKVDLHLEDLWIKNITLTTGLVCATSTPMLMKAVSAGRISPHRLITHTFKMDELEKAYSVFQNAAKEKAMKILIDAA